MEDEAVLRLTSDADDADGTRTTSGGNDARPAGLEPPRDFEATPGRHTLSIGNEG